VLRCGRGVGDFILGELNGANRIIIITPWLSPETARLLRSLAKKASVTLVTTDDDENTSHVKALELLRERVVVKTPGNTGLVFTGLFLILVSAVLAVRVSAWFLLIAPAGGVLLARGLPRERQVPKTPFDVIILPKTTNLHAKLVIIPGKNLVGVGSANLTSSGLHNNIECWVWLSGVDYMREALDFVTSLTGRAITVES